MRTTSTVGDSLGMGSSPKKYVAGPLNNMPMEAINGYGYEGGGYLKRVLDPLDPLQAVSDRYVEAHIHGGVDLKDVKKVWMLKYNDELIKKLEKIGIEWETYPIPTKRAVKVVPKPTPKPVPKPVKKVAFLRADAKKAKMEMANWVEEQFPKQKEIMGTLAPEEMEAVGRYKGTGYIDLNALLRGQSMGSQTWGDPVFWEKRYRKDAKILGKLIDKASLDKDVILYRGASGKWVKALQKGVEFSDKGFTSTSLRESTAFGMASGENAVVIEIRATKGTKGIYLDFGKGTNLGEAEFLLQKGSKFKIVGEGEASHWGRSVRKVIVEVVK